MLHWPGHLDEGGVRTSIIEVEKECFVRVPDSDGIETADLPTVHACETRCPIGGFCSRPRLSGWRGGLDRGKSSIEAQYETDWVALVENDAPPAER